MGIIFGKAAIHEALLPFAKGKDSLELQTSEIDCKLKSCIVFHSREGIDYEAAHGKFHNKVFVFSLLIFLLPGFS